MSLSINRGSEVLQDWVASVKRRPLQQGVSRFVTVARDNVTSTLGKQDNLFISELNISGGYTKGIVKTAGSNTSAKIFKYPDGSWSATTYLGVKPVRTQGEFVIKKKSGEIQKIGYNQKGYHSPDVLKEIFIKNLDRLGDPKYDVDLRDVFGDRPKSKLLRFLGDIKYKVGKFFERFNKQNTEMRRFANSIDTTA